MQQRGNTLTYEEQSQWRFPILIHDPVSGDWVTLKPKNDWSVTSVAYKCPLIISEVVSQDNVEDRWRMLVEAIVAARVGHHLRKTTSQKPFFVTAIYFTKQLEAEVYVLHQASSTEPRVNYFKTTFELSYDSDAVNFLRSLYILRKVAEESIAELDDTMTRLLSDVDAAAKPMHSFTSRPNVGRTPRASHQRVRPPLPIIGEHRDDDEPEDEEACYEGFEHLGVFMSTEVRALARKIYRKPTLLTMASGRDDLALIELAAIEPPTNHIIRPTDYLPTDKGTVIFMPAVGHPITDLDLTYLWKHVDEIARELFEAVAFLHAHNIAHLDLKPENIVIPPTGGRLTIIDFGSAMRVKSPKPWYKGWVRGTKGYIAPEAEKGERFWPLRADVYSLGRVAQEMSYDAGSKRLMDFADKLVVDDPLKRPTMEEIVCM
ncbi:kinase-like domain-containing protein [Fomitopsis serialis]|uniref:kinase-like domain-containing protein n=1 Tax=Fomitopsis serialis TaxID=139415 RepID=UPI00200750A6|nr:kinase-like domain-containing protein [Neoantrodia serialis]KAH9932993.1 kinase-like domain-containing protein [Neoantrodia serialis]